MVDTQNKLSKVHMTRRDWRPGPNYGTDFRGGTELQVLFKKPVEVQAVRAAVESIPGFSRPDVVATSGCGGGAAGDAGCFLIRVQEVSAITTEAGKKVRASLCYRGSTLDEKGDATEDPELDSAKCVKNADGNVEISIQNSINNLITLYNL